VYLINVHIPHRIVVRTYTIIGGNFLLILMPRLSWYSFSISLRQKAELTGEKLKSTVHKLTDNGAVLISGDDGLEPIRCMA